MQASMKTQPYDRFDPVYDGVFEAPIDTEYSLPDYCPDIRKLIKCQVTPEISSYLVSDDALQCEGACDIRVLYLSTGGDRLRCAEFTKEFSASVPIRSAGEKAVAWVEASIGRAACRAVSARRLDLHITVSLKALAVIQRQELIPSDVEDEAMEKRRSTYRVSQAVNALSHQFSLEDTVALKNGKPPVETILRKCAVCRVGDVRVGDGQLTVSGTAEISFLYLAPGEEGTVEKMDASIGFNEVISCSGADSGCTVDLRAGVGEISLQPKEDDVGEYTALSVLVRVFLAAFLYKPCDLEVIDDAYSVRAPLTLRTGQSDLLTALGSRSEVFKKKCVLTVPEEGVEKVLDVWCEQAAVQSSCDKGKLSYRARATACMLYRNGEGMVSYAERPMDHTFSLEMEDDQPKKSDTVLSTDVWEYRIADRGTVEVTLEMSVSTFLSAKIPMKYVASLEADPNAPAYDTGARLVVYYAEDGECVWEIAKSHRALLSDVREQNDLYEDKVSGHRPIIILNR